MPLHVPEKYRVTTGLGSYNTTKAFGNNGVFFITIKKVLFHIIVGEACDDNQWDHVSVSLKTRCPTWEEMCAIKDIFFDPDDVVVQYHPAKKDYVNFHPYCLHMWRYNGTMPVPEKIRV